MDSLASFLSSDAFAQGLGYAASVLILVSLVTANVFRLRLLNGVGSFLFGAYGLLIGAWPVCAINWLIAGIDAWYLVKTATAAAFFELMPAADVGAPYLRRFFFYHERDILRFTPGVSLESLLSGETFVLTRNLLPVGIFSFRQDGDLAEIAADYTIPEYRDFKAGRFLYRDKRLFFKERGIRSFAGKADSPAQAMYYRRNGFREDPPGRFRLDL